MRPSSSSAISLYVSWTKTLTDWQWWGGGRRHDHDWLSPLSRAAWLWGSHLHVHYSLLLFISSQSLKGRTGFGELKVVEFVIFDHA